MQDKVIAIVVTYNRKDLLAECLSSLQEQTYKLSKIILIDNASTDGTYDFIHTSGRFNQDLIEYVQMETNTGGAGGFYEGIRRAREMSCDWIWVMDDDTIPDNNALEELIEKKNMIGEEVSFVSSCVYGLNGEYMNVPNIAETRGQNGYRDWYCQLQNSAVKIADATFVSTLINKKAVLECGLPCKDFFIWGDDTEYTMRIIKNYGPAYLIGTSKVIHKRFNAKRLLLQEETAPGRIDMYKYFYRNNLINKSLYMSKRSFVKFLLGGIRTSLKSLGTEYGLKKFCIVYKGMFSFFIERNKFSSYISQQLKGYGNE